MLLLCVVCLIVGLAGVGLAVGWSLVAATLWFLVKLPVAIVILGIGIVMCCTIILIPLGVPLIRSAFGVLF